MHLFPKDGHASAAPPLIGAAGPCNGFQRASWDMTRGTLGLLEPLVVMSNFQWFLHRIPAPSVRLFLMLAMFGALVVMSFAMLDGSGHNRVAPHVQADHIQADQH